MKIYKSGVLRNQSSSGGNASSHNRTIVILFVITAVFFITTFSGSIWTSLQITGVVSNKDHDEARYHWTVTVRACFTVLQFVNNACNFLLYSITGSKFRNELKAMFSFCKCCSS